jgi:hypothetical protein
MNIFDFQQESCQVYNLDINIALLIRVLWGLGQTYVPPSPSFDSPSHCIYRCVPSLVDSRTSPI